MDSPVPFTTLDVQAASSFSDPIWIPVVTNNLTITLLQKFFLLVAQ